MPRWVYFLLFVGCCVTAIHLVRGVRAVARGRLRPVGMRRQLTGWPARWAGLILVIPLLGLLGTGGQLGQRAELSGDAGELSAQLTEGWAKARAAKGDEPTRQVAVKECSEAVRGLILAYGSDFTLLGLLCAVVVWVWAAAAAGQAEPAVAPDGAGHHGSEEAKVP
jgi:hypothetical protein